MSNTNKRILMAGGGSGGPVMPLLAVATELRKLHPEIQFLFVGTQAGPERKVIEEANFNFVTIPAAKLRRYFSFSNITDIFVFIRSYFKSRKIIREFQPDFVFSVGGYVAVPVCWAARRAKIPVAIHQQDARIGLANKLIAPFASFITTAFEATAKEFPSGSGLKPSELKPAAKWVGNPVRKEFFEPATHNAKGKFGLLSELPILLVTGGGTGATQINQVVAECLPELVKTHQIIHQTGTGKNNIVFHHQNYHAFEFLSEDFPDAMKIADIVLARAGLSTISELSVLKKVSIIVPMPDTHQEDNATILKAKASAIVLDKFEFNPQDLPRIVTSVKFNPARQVLLAENISNIMPHDAAAHIASLIYPYVK